MIAVMMRFVDCRRRGGDDFEVRVPRVPVAGDVVVGPDDFGVWVVREVRFEYRDGLAFEPDVTVVLGREPSA